tara:strand:+ start:3585 stop:3767 length:183 start_codon:yes stop_codon:yes gene_type:complete
MNPFTSSVDMEPNTILIDRIMFYMAQDEPHKAAALARTGDWLEECYHGCGDQMDIYFVEE